jgi:gag-polypeptide of LTR copia-type/Zinc knuckle
MANVNSLLGNVPKLDGNNYHDWKFAISMVLRRAGCWDVLTKDKPATRSSGDDWEKKSEEALTYIGLTISQDQYSYIRDSSDGPSAWKALAEIYEKNSRATRISLKRQFYGYQHDDTRPIAEYITGITDLAARLKSIKVKLLDEDIIDVLIFNLHESWGNIAASLTASMGELGLTNVTGALLDEEGRRGRPEVRDTTAMVARRIKRAKSITCFRCGKLGHMAKDCEEKITKGKTADMAAVAEDFAF